MVGVQMPQLWQAHQQVDTNEIALHFIRKELLGMKILNCNIMFCKNKENDYHCCVQWKESPRTANDDMGARLRDIIIFLNRNLEVYSSISDNSRNFKK